MPPPASPEAAPVQELARAEEGADPNPRRVAIFGGGPAGMTAAHELAERGFEVDLYERHEVLGGKVRSFNHPRTGTDGRADLPGNMGGHFFLSSYPNLGETMGRIPVAHGRSVLDNLTAGPDGLKLTFAWDDTAARIPVPWAPTLPGVFKQALSRRSIAEIHTLLKKMSVNDVVLLVSKMLALVTSGEERLWGQLEHLSLGDYLRSERLSTEARRISTLLGPYGFANADGANTRAFAQLMGFTAHALAGRPDHNFTTVATLLNGPENEAWTDPWETHLRSLGTRFHLKH